MPDQRQSKMKLDDNTIEQKVLLYPEVVREPVQWLAAFCRERCNRQVSILQKKSAEAGHTTDYSYWFKIFVGSYFLTKPGTTKTIGNVDNFLQIVEAIRAKDRIEWRAGRMPFIETGTWHLIEDFIDKKRQPARVNKFGSIIGPTGSQKTACFKEYQARNNHGKCVHIEAPEKPLMGQLITDLARIKGEGTSGRHSSLKRKITESINETKCIIIDNVQRLYKAEHGGDQEIFNFLQKLQDDTGCTIIMSFTPFFAKQVKEGGDRGYFEQFIGRMGGMNKALILPDYAPREDVLQIATAYGLQDAEKHVKYLEQISRELGRIRILFDDLQDAKQEAGAEPLTIEHLRLVRGEDEKE